MNERYKPSFVLLLACLCAFAFSGCQSVPAVVIDTTPVDNVILDVSDTAGDIEAQVITVHDTVTKVISESSQEDKEKIEKQFSELYQSIAHLKTLPSELSRVHAIEVGKLASEISRLKPFEVETEKQKSAKWRAYSIIGILAVLIAVYIFLKVKRFLPF